MLTHLVAVTPGHPRLSRRAARGGSLTPVGGRCPHPAVNRSHRGNGLAAVTTATTAAGFPLLIARFDWVVRDSHSPAGFRLAAARRQ